MSRLTPTTSPPVGLSKISTPRPEVEYARYSLEDLEKSIKKWEKQSRRRSHSSWMLREKYKQEKKQAQARSRVDERREESQDKETRKNKKEKRVRRRRRRNPAAEHFSEKHVRTQYKIIRYLGHGSYGHVCEAMCRATKQRVAIKKVPGIFDNEVDAKRLLRELRILREFRNHVAIINMVSIIPPPDLVGFNVLNIVFEFVDTDLAKLMNSDQSFTTLHVQYMIYQIFLGVKYIHSAGIAHRDIKPANILVNENCTVRICDFGLARGLTENFDTPVPVFDFLPEDSDDEKRYIKKMQRASKSRELTRHVVTRWYRAPEVILLEQQREWLLAVDMWAVGCVLAELFGMLKENCRDYSKRQPLFPGTSCFPLSAKDPFDFKSRRDQLNVIFDEIGTPKKSEIKVLKTEQAKSYLYSLKARPPKDWRKRFPGSSQSGVDLLFHLVRFDCRKRLTVNQALSHAWLKNVRDESAEVRHERIKFDFEDIPLKIRTIKSLIIDELMRWKTECVELPKPPDKPKSDEDDEKRDAELMQKHSDKDRSREIRTLDKDVGFV